MILLLNLVEELNRTNRALQAENQRLKDEINRLKGEQGQPPIQPNVPLPPTTIPRRKNGGRPNRVPSGVNERRSPLTGKLCWKRSGVVTGGCRVQGLR